MWNQAIVRELTVVLLIKLTALYVIWLAFFNQPDERELTHHEIGQLLLGESRNSVTPPHQPMQHTGVRDGH
jgi:hypothetical protein